MGRGSSPSTKKKPYLNYKCEHQQDFEEGNFALEYAKVLSCRGDPVCVKHIRKLTICNYLFSVLHVTLYG